MRWIIALLLIISLFITACNITTDAVQEINGCSSLESAARDDCYFEARKCSKIQDSTVRDSCVAELAKAKIDLAVCGLIQDKKTEGYCQEQIAELTNDKVICDDLIEDWYWQDNCFFNLALNNQKGELCLEVRDNNQRYNCLDDVAKATNDASWCRHIFEGEDTKRDGCFLTVAKQTQQIELCQEMTTLLREDTCRLKIAKLANKIEYCDLIGFHQLKTDCKNYFSES